MATTRFLGNDNLWDELREKVKKAKSVKAAVAYLGSGGADLLSLKKGDTLVVNMGMQTVKQGITSPKEVQRLMKRGVSVFSRTTLHAKFFICDKSLIVGSANISNNSQNVLDEAGSVTNCPQAVRRADDFFDKLCTEPVRPEYLKKCLAAYKPPKFNSSKVLKRNNKSQKRVVSAKLWFVGGLVRYDVPEKEKEKVERIESQAENRLTKSNGTSVESTHYHSKTRYLENIRVGDWVVECVAEPNKKRFVSAPSQVIGLESYPRGQGKKRYLLLREESNKAQEMPLERFQSLIGKIAPSLASERLRTSAITSTEVADAILSIWTPSGRIAKKSVK
jgi:hypothetical protein